MYPKVCPICKRPEQYAGRGFEHISMFIRGERRGTLYLRCNRCHNTFPWEYGDPGKTPTVLEQASGVVEAAGSSSSVTEDHEDGRSAVKS